MRKLAAFMSAPDFLNTCWKAIIIKITGQDNPSSERVPNHSTY